MWIRIAILMLIGLSAGIVTAAGYFAVITSIGVITRFADNTHTAKYIGLYEIAIIAGATIGNIFIVFMPSLPMWGGFSTVWFFFGGIFIGCFLVSLAEAVKGIPVFLRRTKLTKGLGLIIIALALGKGIGSLIYFMLYVGR